MATTSLNLNPPKSIIGITGRGSVGKLKWGKSMIPNKLVKPKKSKDSFSNWGKNSKDPFKS